MFGGCLRPPRIFIVEELMTATLSSVVHHRHRRIGLSRTLRIAHDVASGLSYLHSLGIVHRGVLCACAVRARVCVCLRVRVCVFVCARAHAP